MELSILVAKIVAIYYVGIGLGVVTGQVEVKKMIASFEDPGLSLISGLFMITVGGLLVNAHNIWVKDWTVLITIIGWALVIKGFLFTAFPKSMVSMSKSFGVRSKSFGYLVIAIGLVFGYFGFVA